MSFDIEIEKPGAFGCKLVDARSGCSTQNASPVDAELSIANVIGQEWKTMFGFLVWAEARYTAVAFLSCLITILLHAPEVNYGRAGLTARSSTA